MKTLIDFKKLLIAFSLILNSFEIKLSKDNDEILIEPIRNKNIPLYSCRNKEDDGYYEHEESCQKYWHCLYVDTIFERAFERKCPIGTMFHPIYRSCEISTMLTCSGWKRSIFGKEITDQAQLSSSLPPRVETPPQYSTEINEEVQINDYELNNNNNNNNQLKDKYLLKAFITAESSTVNSVENKNYQMPIDYYLNSIEYTSIPITTRPNLKIFKPKILLTTTTSSSTTTTTTTTSTSTTTATSTTSTTSTTATSKWFKRIKNKRTSTTSSKIGTLEEKINELMFNKLSFLTSNKLNRTQIYNEIETIKGLFELHNAAQTSSSTTTSTSATTTTTTSTTTSTTVISSEYDSDEYEYDMKQISSNKFLPLIYIATTTIQSHKNTTLIKDYNEEEEEEEDEEQNYDYNRPKAANISNSLQSNQILTQNFEPLESDTIISLKSSSSNINKQINWTLYMIVFFKFFFKVLTKPVQYF